MHAGREERSLNHSNCAPFFGNRHRSLQGSFPQKGCLSGSLQTVFPQKGIYLGAFESGFPNLGVLFGWFGVHCRCMGRYFERFKPVSRKWEWSFMSVASGFRQRILIIGVHFFFYAKRNPL